MVKLKKRKWYFLQAANLLLDTLGRNGKQFNMKCFETCTSVPFKEGY